MTEVVRKSALKGRFGGRGKRPREGDSGAALAESAASGHTSKPARRDNVQQPSQQVHFQLHSYAMMLEMQGDLLGAKQQYLEALKVKPDFAPAAAAMKKLEGIDVAAVQATFDESLLEDMYGDGPGLPEPAPSFDLSSLGDVIQVEPEEL